MPADIESFARRLLAATEQAKIDWQPTERDPEAFIAQAGAGSVRMSRQEVGPPGFDLYAYRLELLDADGRVVETLQTDPGRSGPWLDWEQTLNSLYPAARLTGSGTSKVIEGLAQEWALPSDPEDIPF